MWKKLFVCFFLFPSSALLAAEMISYLPTDVSLYKSVVHLREYDDEDEQRDIHSLRGGGISIAKEIGRITDPKDGEWLDYISVDAASDYLYAKNPTIDSIAQALQVSANVCFKSMILKVCYPMLGVGGFKGKIGTKDSADAAATFLYLLGYRIISVHLGYAHWSVTYRYFERGGDHKYFGIIENGVGISWHQDF